MHILSRNTLAALSLITTLLLPGLARATLGGGPSSAQADGARMKASLRVTTAAQFAVHEMTLAHGTVIREFVSPQGVVFAIAWNGPVKPDLRALMGPYYGRYLEGAPNTRGAHSAVAVARPDLVLHSGGHMRAFAGHAYLPGMIPAGVTAADLQAGAGDLP